MLDTGRNKKQRRKIAVSLDTGDGEELVYMFVYPSERVIDTFQVHLRELLSRGGIRLVDFSSLFGTDGLDPTLTHDGLHLNAAGTARLSSLLQAVAVAATGARVCP